jgi:RNA polymerase subunit RPABC4/transcription elongation factor Spt4
MTAEKESRQKRCPNCHSVLDRIWFTALMIEEWALDDDGYRECTARHSLVTDPEQPVLCPECEAVVGTGLDFGFGTGCK